MFSIRNAQVVVCLESGKIHIIVIIFNHNKLKYLVCLLWNVIILSLFGETNYHSHNQAINAYYMHTEIHIHMYTMCTYI